MKRVAIAFVVLLVALFVTTPVVMAQPCPNLVINGGFANTANWTHFNPANLTFQVVGGQGVLNVINVVAPPNENPNLQLYQTPICLLRNHVYRLRFKAMSSNGNNIYVGLIKHTSPFTQYTQNPEFDLTPVMTQYETTIWAFGLPQGVSEVCDARLRFFIDWRVTSLPLTYTIDDVELVDLTGPCNCTSLPTIVTQPANTTVTCPAPATFSVSATAPPECSLTYRWQRGTTDIPGATSASYTLNPTAYTDNAATFRVIVGTSFGSVTSNAAVLTVNNCIVPCVNNIVRNWTFDNGTADWTHFDPANLNFNVAAGDAILTVVRLVPNGGNPNLQLYQYPHTLVKGKWYQIQLAAKSSNGSDIFVGFIPHVPPYPNAQYTQNPQIDLTQDIATYKVNVWAYGLPSGVTSVTDARLRLYIDYRAAAGTVYTIASVAVCGLFDTPPPIPKQGDVAVVTPIAYALDQNYPNPFNPTTNISFTIPKDGMVSLRVFDVLGREVASLVNDVRVAGSYTEVFDASQLSSGTYLYRLESGSFVQTKKMLIMK